MGLPELEQPPDVEEAVLAGTEALRGSGEDCDLHDVAARDGFDECLGAAEGVVVRHSGQPGQAVGGPEGKAEVQPDLVAVVEAEVGDEMVPAAGQGEYDEGDVEDEEALVEADAEGEKSECGCQGEGNRGDNSPVLPKMLVLGYRRHAGVRLT